MYISNPDELADFCDRASRCKAIAVDTEFLRERTYYPRLCLVQVGLPDEVDIIDPLLIDDLGPLAELFGDDRIVKVFHACSQDLEVLFDHLGSVPTPVFDTQVAASFLGHRTQLGYGPLVQAYTGVHLAKAEALTDWSRRPLDPEQLQYAEDDVRYLPGIYQEMLDELVRTDRLGWVERELDEVLDPRQFERRPEDAYLHLKRSKTLTRKQLGVAREVCAWREETAASRDVPRRWILSDDVVVEVCRRSPKTVDRLRRIRGMESLSAQDAAAIVEAVLQGLSCASDELPPRRHHQRPSVEAESVADLMNAVLKLKSDESGIAPQVIATRDDLLDFISGGGGRLSRGWRYDLVGSLLERLLAGEVGLTVREGRVELL